MIKLLILTLFFINVSAKNTLKPKKFTYCEEEYYDLEHLCDQKTINTCKKKKISNCDTKKGCGESNAALNSRKNYFKLERPSFEKEEERCFFRIFGFTKEGYPVDGGEVDCDEKGITSMSNCHLVFIFADLEATNKRPIERVFLNKHGQELFCSRLKICSDIVKDAMVETGILKVDRKNIVK